MTHDSSAVSGTKLCKILIIDDDTDDVEILADVFKTTGVESIHYVHTAMEAFVYLEEVKNKADLPKLIVTDLHLRGITGHEFLKDLKGMEPYRHIHVIVLSSHKSEREIEKARQLGVLDYIEKPNTYDEYVKVASEIKSKAGL
jgi:CheY-like chemotaxis protein